MKKLNPSPISVSALDNYRILIGFDNNEKRIFDLSPYLDDKFFQPLKNIAIFNTVRINPITVEWANGIDLCPDDIYELSVSV